MSNKEKNWKCLAPVDLIACSFGADACLPVGRLSYKLSITTQNFLNILYWFEERNTINKDWMYFIVEVVEQKAWLCTEAPSPLQMERRMRGEVLPSKHNDSKFFKYSLLV